MAGAKGAFGRRNVARSRVLRNRLTGIRLHATARHLAGDGEGSCPSHPFRIGRAGGPLPWTASGRNARGRIRVDFPRAPWLHSRAARRDASGGAPGGFARTVARTRGGSAGPGVRS